MKWSLPKVLLTIFIVAYITYLATYSVLRVKNLYAEYFDVGIMHQTVHNSYMALKTGDFGRILELTDPHGSPRQIKRMAIHNDPILALLAPFYFIHDGPETILILQTLVLALGAYAVFLIAERLLKNDWLALAFSFAYLMYPPMQWANIFEFHAVTFATTGILFMVYFWLTKRYGLSLLFMALSLLTKEEVGLSIGLFGLYTMYHAWNTHDKKQPRWYSYIVTGVSWAWSLLSAFVIIPLFNGGKHFASGYYDNLVPNILPRMLRSDTAEYFVYTLGPVLFLTLLAPHFLVVAGPELGINLLASDEQLRNITFHYVSVIQPWFFVGAMFGTSTLLKSRPNIARSLSFALVISSLVFAYLSSPLPFTKNPKFDAVLYQKPAERKFVEQWAETLKDDSIKVSSTDQIAPYFTARRYFYIFSPNYQYADYVIISKGNLQYTYRKEVTDPAYKSLQEDIKFKKIADEIGYEVYKKQ